MNDEFIPSTVKVWAATLGALTLSISDVQAIVSIVALLVATGYTLWKWRRDAKRKTKEEKQ